MSLVTIYNESRAGAIGGTLALAYGVGSSVDPRGLAPLPSAAVRDNAGILTKACLIKSGHDGPDLAKWTSLQADGEDAPLAPSLRLCVNAMPATLCPNAPRG